MGINENKAKELAEQTADAMVEQVRPIMTKVAAMSAQATLELCANMVRNLGKHGHTPDQIAELLAGLAAGAEGFIAAEGANPHGDH